MKKYLDDCKMMSKENSYYGVIPCNLTAPIALFANKSDAEEYAQIFNGLSKEPSRMSTKPVEDYKISQFQVSF